ncbi:MAG: glutathione S-transferase family protein [Rhodospirillaceae bacterium]|jgi:glutathione S-transferase|nr:glutathione S-transferase family protein [Rhodospirillaceae bacterium]MBT4489079.1 glutathione S-transferase family protein [Rhodospirillaceae bacterium]MBT5193537.1 glutathione S-transferase family protein [Rhodospirillaceae bacterium]MBT5896904.1 glutathione S-transferase family protein [Rhodospirillaceae bacterium]MBT6431364.1 glutathione S-transferase family protein [Rhodospirillaceae bacterium]
MADLRIFSYMPNPRIWKATIAARLCGVELDLRGAKPGQLADWLWDFDARPLTAEDRAKQGDLARQSRTGFSGQLFKTDAFLAAHPFGTVPAAFSPDGEVGIFESNSIARTVARLRRHGPDLYGDDPYAAARIDSFLDVSLVFARDGQVYLLSLNNGSVDEGIHGNAAAAYETYMNGMEAALSPDHAYLVGDDLTLADIVFVAELCSFAREAAHLERLAERNLPTIFKFDAPASHPRAMAHFERLCQHPAFVPDIEPFMEKLEARRLKSATG